MVSAYGSNTWGLDFSAESELFFTMANGSHLRHVVLSERDLAAGRMGKVESWLDVTDHAGVFPLRAHERPPYQQIDFVGGFTAASGGCIYTGGAWPAELDGDHFTCEPTVNLVHRDSLEPRAVTFAATKPREAEFIASTDLWFRPVHLRVGPDGALYVLDFYNQAAVHNDTRGPEHGPTNAAVRPDRDHAHGRIWRVQHRAAQPAPVPALAEASELVAALAHPNGWVRGTAQRLLSERGRPAPATLAALRATAVGADAVATRVAALWTLARVAPQELPDAARALLGDPEPAVRTNVLRALAALDEWSLARALPRPETLLDESDARARLAALVLARRVLPDSGFRRLIGLYLGLADDWSRSAVLAIASQRPARFVEAALAEAGPAELDALLAALAAGVVRRNDLGAAVGIVTALGERRTTVAGPPLALLDGLARLDPRLVPWPSPQLDRALVKLLASPHPEVAIAALPLCARWSQSRGVVDARAALGARLEELVSDPDGALELRLGALAAMLGLPDRQRRGAELAALFLDPLFPPDVQTRVIAALEPVDPVEPGAEVLCASFERLSQPARERAVALLLVRPASTGVLLDALEREELRAAELGPQVLHRLRTHPDPATAARASALLAELVGGERDDKDALVAELAPLVDRPGDPVRGRELFVQNCGTCHTAEGAGTRGNVGPDLTGMGAHGARELLPFLLDPNRAVEPAYLEYVVETTGGELVAGVIARETADSILLRSSSGEREVPRAEIAELRSTGRSPMPVGFESLGAEGLRDLLTFLAGDWAGFRVIDLRPYCSSSTARGLYDTRHDARPMRFRQHGVVGVEGVPFELLDPARMGAERNALTLRGGMAEGWESKGYPQRVEIPLGYALARLHVLGGIAAWGYPFTQSRTPAVKLTWVYADGQREERVLADGAEIADWIGRHEVPGSRWVDLLAEGSWGQARVFAVEPARPDAIVETLVLESFDNHLAPTFLALTAQLAGADPHAGGGDAAPGHGAGEWRVLPAPRAPQVLIFGGGSSHDYRRWSAGTDVETLGALGKVVAYSEDPAELARALETLEVLVLCNNQPLPDPALRSALLAFVERGGGLVLVHAATWFNWADWPEYNRVLAGGGARSHEEYGELGVRIVGAGAEHPVTSGVPRSFTVADELYRFEPDDGGPGEVLAVGRSLVAGSEYPLVWTRAHGRGRIVALTLGHDGAAHEHAAYRKLLANAVEWVLPR
jgi:putative heme-binding domain-containing protein